MSVRNLFAIIIGAAIAAATATIVVKYLFGVSSSAAIGGAVGGAIAGVIGASQASKKK